MTAINSGSHCTYYHAKVDHPENPNQFGTPYEANCEDIIKALGMTFDEGCEFKSLWRRARARQGFVKAESDAVRDATKALHYAGRVLRAEQQKVAIVSPGIDATSADSAGREFVSQYDWSHAKSWATHALKDMSGITRYVSDQGGGGYVELDDEGVSAIYIFTEINCLAGSIEARPQ